MKKRCHNCQHFIPSATSDVGKCRRYPPVAAWVFDPSKNEVVLRSSQPTTKEEHRCGEWSSGGEDV